MDTQRTFNQKDTYLKNPLAVLGIRLAGLFVIYTLCRIVFFLFNHAAFPEAALHYFIYGIRFDMEAIVITNAPYFLLLLLPFAFVAKPVTRKIGDIYFVIINTLAVITNIIDTCYYPFAMRRMTCDIFSFIGETNNFGELVPVFLKDYFYMIFVLIGFFLLLLLLVHFSNKVDYRGFVMRAWRRWVQAGIRLVIAAALLVGARGGFQLRPLTVAAAGSVGGIEYAALVLNSPFSLITTIQSDKIDEKHYFSDEVCDQIFDINRYSFDNQYFECPPTDHVVVIILEGIASEYSDFFADEPKKLAGFTPFIDSLAQKSITYRGMANGQHSIEAVASILGSIPSLMSKPFSQSTYATDYVSYALPQLTAQGFSTHFYHGGKNGSMGFDRMSQLAGVQHYYGMDEYPHSRRDFDGSWGIPDVPYLNYVADQLDHIDGKFFATIFTLSSHHPFKVPTEYDGKVKRGDIPMQHTVAYADEALRQFFAKVSKTDWYERTLFVITSDHTTFDDAKEVDFQRNRYTIPMIFFHPQQQEVYHSDEIMQQVDIMPSIFGYCGFKAKFISFGHNVFEDGTPRFAIDHLSGTYQFYIDQYLIEFDGRDAMKVWDLKTPMPRQEVDPKKVERMEEYEQLMKAVIQQYHNRLNRNQLKVK
ncbi:MAG: sulfatase-like hydrolase/transferase [Bacteroidales bacterium]|nr:sulfatase-like hydrolase/transferase [Bacteroidales bacterium]